MQTMIHLGLHTIADCRVKYTHKKSSYRLETGRSVSMGSTRTVDPGVKQHQWWRHEVINFRLNISKTKRDASLISSEEVLEIVKSNGHLTDDVTGLMLW